MLSIPRPDPDENAGLHPGTTTSRMVFRVPSYYEIEGAATALGEARVGLHSVPVEEQQSPGLASRKPCRVDHPTSNSDSAQNGIHSQEEPSKRHLRRRTP